MALTDPAGEDRSGAPVTPTMPRKFKELKIGRPEACPHGLAAKQSRARSSARLLVPPAVEQPYSAKSALLVGGKFVGKSRF